MFKLLTEESKAQVKKEYFLRRYVVALSSLSVVALIALVGIFPSYILSIARQQEVAERARVLGEGTPQQGEADLSEWLALFNQKLKLLSPKLDKDRASGMIEAGLAEKGSGISVIAISWVKRDSEILLSMQGVARDRQALIAFEKRLNASGQFESVALPVSNLAKDSNINFQVKLSPKKIQ
jgi:hypothetical protein